MNIDATALPFLHFIIFISLIGPPKIEHECCVQAPEVLF